MTAQLASHLTRALTLAQQQPYLARRQNWVNQLERHAMMQPDAPALRFVGNTMTWADLRRRVAALAGALSGRGVGFGDRVMILMLNRTEFVESVLAANMIGAIAVPLNFRLTPTEIAVLVEDCVAHVMLTEAALAPVAIGVRNIQPLLSVIVVAGGSSQDSVFGYEDLLNEAGDVHEPVDIPNDSPALIMYTSGTTGRPKGAVLTHANLTGQAMTALYTSGANINSDVGFVGVPLFHIAGIGNMLTGLLLGLPTVIYPLGAFDPGQLLDVLEAEKVTGIFLVPAQWQAVCTEQQARPRDLRLRVLSWGAAPAPDALVVDQNMNDVPVGEVGEIVYRAPTLMSCYWNNPEATAEAFAGGWFHSGDLVRMDSDGYVWVVDRKKDMIISGGENIYCAELENVLASHPDIAEVAVIGRADEKWGEVPIAVAAVTNDDLRIEDLGEFLTDRLARYKHPKALEIVDALPRNPAGKVLKTELRLRYGACVNVERRSASAGFTERRENRQKL